MSQQPQQPCDQVTATAPPPEYLEAMLALYVLVLVCVLGGLGLFLVVRRRSGRLAKRSFALLVLSGSAAVVSATSVLLREYLGRAHFSCTAMMAMHYLVIPLALGPLTVKVNVHAFRLRRSYARASMMLLSSSSSTVAAAADGIDDAPGPPPAPRAHWLKRLVKRFASFLTLKSAAPPVAVTSAARHNRQLPASRTANHAHNTTTLDTFVDLKDDDDADDNSSEGGGGDDVEAKQQQQQPTSAAAPFETGGRRGGQLKPAAAAAAARSSFLSLYSSSGATTATAGSFASLPLPSKQRLVGGDLVRNESTVFSLAMVVLLALPFCAAIAVRVLLPSSSSSACVGGVGCDFALLDVYILTALTGVLCAGFCLATVRMWHSPDPLFVLWECKLCMLVFLVLALPQVVLYVTDPLQLERRHQITWWVVECAWTLALFVIQSYLQVGSTLLTNRQMMTTKQAAHLLVVLESVHLRDMFDDHLASEFSIENLRFWDSAIHWKSQYGKLGPHERERQARELFASFVQRDAAMALNLSSANLRAITAAFASNDNDNGEGKEIPSTVFDGALVECFKLMNDGLARFVRSPKYLREFGSGGNGGGNGGGTVVVDLEGDALRNKALGLDIRHIAVDDYLRQFDELSRQPPPALAASSSSPRRTLSLTPLARKSSLLLFLDPAAAAVAEEEDAHAPQRSRPISMQVRQSYTEDGGGRTTPLSPRGSFKAFNYA